MEATKEYGWNFDEINLTSDEKILWHQNNVQRFHLVENGVNIETKYFGDVYITNFRIVFISKTDRKLFIILNDSIDRVILQKRLSDPHYIKIFGYDQADVRVLWTLEFENEDGASEFRKQLKKIPQVSNKISTSWSSCINDVFDECTSNMCLGPCFR